MDDLIAVYIEFFSRFILRPLYGWISPEKGKIVGRNIQDDLVKRSFCNSPKNIALKCLSSVLTLPLISEIVIKLIFSQLR